MMDDFSCPHCGCLLFDDPIVPLVDSFPTLHKLSCPNCGIGSHAWARFDLCLDELKKIVPFAQNNLFEEV